MSFNTATTDRHARSRVERQRVRRRSHCMDDASGGKGGSPARKEQSPLRDVRPTGKASRLAATGGWDASTFTVEGQSADRAGANSSLNLESIHPNYFATVGVSLIRGRGFGPADREGAPNVVIVSEDVAARTWPGEEPIGKRLKLGGATSEEPWRTVVGVARMTRYRELREPRATVYLPAAQFMFAADAIVLRTASPARVVAGAARERIRAVDPAVQVMRVTPFADLLDHPLARPRFDAFVLGVFGIAALILAAIGLYAVMGAYVRQRDTEIGIRVALGATASDVRRLVVGEGLWLAGLGAVIGLAGAVATTRLLRGLLFGVHPLDARVDARGGAAGRRRVGAGIISTRVARRACRSPHSAQSRLSVRAVTLVWGNAFSAGFRECSALLYRVAAR